VLKLLIERGTRLMMRRRMFCLLLLPLFAKFGQVSGLSVNLETRKPRSSCIPNAKGLKAGLSLRVCAL
jgi:hypothetical protein